MKRQETAQGTAKHVSVANASTRLSVGKSFTRIFVSAWHSDFSFPDFVAHSSFHSLALLLSLLLKKQRKGRIAKATACFLGLQALICRAHSLLFLNQDPNEECDGTDAEECAKDGYACTQGCQCDYCG